MFVLYEHRVRVSMNGVAPFASKQVDMQKLQRRLCFPVDRWERVRSQSSTDTSITQFVVVNGRSKVGVFQSDNSPVLLCLSDLGYGCMIQDPVPVQAIKKWLCCAGCWTSLPRSWCWQCNA